MTHLEVECLASDYLEGLLDSSLRTAVEAHLADCPPCREELQDLRHALAVCHAAEDLEPSPWLESKILRATIGERKPIWRERIAEFIRPVLNPRVAYPIAMTVFTFSILVNAAGLNLRNLRVEDLNPRTWVGRANRQGHLMFARAEKFYFDLRVVYEIESRVRQLSVQPQPQEEESPKPAGPDGGSLQGAPSEQNVAFAEGVRFVLAARTEPSFDAHTNRAAVVREGRSLNR